MLTAMSTETIASSVRMDWGVTVQPHSFTVFGECMLNTPLHAVTVFTPLVSLPSHSLTLILTKGLRSSPEQALLREPGSESIHYSRASLLAAGCGNEQESSPQTRRGASDTVHADCLRPCTEELLLLVPLRKYSRECVIVYTQMLLSTLN